jgi:hypothetical protein
MSVGVLKDYNLKLRNLRASHTLGRGLYTKKMDQKKNVFLVFFVFWANLPGAN